MIDPKVAGRVALVTGANNPEGIGAAIARALARQGAQVFVTGLPVWDQSRGDDPAELGDERYARLRSRSIEDLVEELRRLGATAEGGEWDLAQPHSIKALLDEARERLGEVSVLINNAAHCLGDSFLPRQADAEASMISAEHHDRHFAVNSRAPGLLMAEFARRHIERAADWGRIINVSTDGASGHAGAVSYGASKHALESYSRAAAWELGPYGITVNTLAPGPVQTGWISPQMEERLKSQIPLRRIGRPEDIADAAIFLTSDQARWITGQVLYVGGGHVMPL